MKRILKFSLLILVISCSTKKNVIIPYLLDLSTEKSVYKEIINSNKNIVFYFESLPENKIKIYLVSLYDNDFLSTNRKLFINDKFYPVIFEHDYSFYSNLGNDGKPVTAFEVNKYKFKDIPIPTIQEREKNPDAYGYKRKLIIIDNSIYWIIDKKGKLIETNSIR
jgi:hypothetical protein